MLHQIQPKNPSHKLARLERLRPNTLALLRVAIESHKLNEHNVCSIRMEEYRGIVLGDLYGAFSVYPHPA